MLAEFGRTGNSGMVKKLEAALVTTEDGVPRAYIIMLREEAMHMVGGGTMHSMRSVVTGIMLPSFASPQYTLTEIRSIQGGQVTRGHGCALCHDDTMDLSQTLPVLAIPVYFLEEKYGPTYVYSLAKAYFDVVTAPVKGFYTFETSAHSAMFEEPEKMRWILRERCAEGKERASESEIGALAPNNDHLGVIMY